MPESCALQLAKARAEISEAAAPLAVPTLA
jgi:hypothetical protein